jgi:glycerate dehydrogenase
LPAADIPNILYSGQFYGNRRNDMQIVILDGYTLNPGDLSWAGFEALGETTVYGRTAAVQTAERIGSAEVIFTNKTPISRDILAQCPSVRFIGVLATGYNVVDIAAAKEKGIIVCNVPEYGTNAVGQYAIAMLLEICHHIGHHSNAVHQGRWASGPDFCFWDYPLIEMAGKMMGIIGYGRIGKATGRIAQAMGMRVLAYDKVNDPGEESCTMRYAALDEVLNESDVIALHCPLLPETKGIICTDSIAKMKDGVIILNNSRGQLIIEGDLAAALQSGKVYAAAVDVVSEEPINPDNPLLSAPNCLITPHISWAPKESRARLLGTSVENLSSFLKGRPIHVVNS